MADSVVAVSPLTVLITTIPAILAAIGVLYTIITTKNKDKVVAVKALETDTKLDVIHSMVNSQLTEAVNRYSVEQERSRLLQELLISVAPENPAVKTLIASMGGSTVK